MYCTNCGKNLEDEPNFCIYCGFNLRDNKPRIYTLSFNVAGVTFENRQDIIKKIVKSAINEGVIEAYNGMSNKEILENGFEVYETEYLSPDSVRIKPTTYEEKDAIEVYITDNNKEYMIGFVPKKTLKEAFDFLKKIEENEDYKLSIDAYFTGGKIKDIEYDYENDKDKIITREINYGIEVNLKLEKQ